MGNKRNLIIGFLAALVSFPLLRLLSQYIIRICCNKHEGSTLPTSSTQVTENPISSLQSNQSEHPRAGSSTEQQLPTIKFYKYDPVLRLGLDVLHLNWWKGWILYAIFKLVVRFGYAWRVGTLGSSGNYVGALEDWPGTLSDFIVKTSIASIYIWLPTAISKILISLEDGELVDLEDDAYHTFRRQIDRSLNSPFLNLIIILLALASVPILIKPGIVTPQPMWYNVRENPITYPDWILFNYMGIRIIFYWLVTIVNLQRMYRKVDVHISLFHPDKAGGWAQLGKFSLSIVYVLVLMSVDFALEQLATIYIWEDKSIWRLDRIITQGGYIIFVILAPILFFAPLVKVHERFVAYKNFLKTLVLEKNKLILKNLAATNATINNLQLEHIIFDKYAELKTLYDIQHLLEHHPEWPINTQTFRRFFASLITIVTLPITTFILPIITSMIANYLYPIFFP